MRKKLLLEFVLAINENLLSFHMQIKKGVSEEDGSNYYGLVCKLVFQSFFRRMYKIKYGIQAKSSLYASIFHAGSVCVCL